MTLKSGRSASAGSMRTALSDLYLEHLLQNRAKPEVLAQHPEPSSDPARSPPEFASVSPFPHTQRGP